MSHPQVFVSRAVAPEALARLTAIANVEVWPEQAPPSHQVLVDKASRVDALFTLLTDPIDAAVIQATGPNFKGIAQMAVGFDNIDIAAATQRGLPVGHTPGVLTETTADFTWALLMAVSRRIVEGNNEVRRGVWRPWGPSVLTGKDIHGATLGIIGFGRIGQAVARRASGFNMRILYHDIKPLPEAEQALGATYVSLETLLAQSDYVTIHTYLSRQTQHMMGKAQFEQMKPGAYLINTARGAIVDQDALLWALQEGKIAGAALDVTVPEPIGQSPLLQFENVIITPHIASASTATRLRMAHMTVDNILAMLQGERIPYCANPQIYEG